MQVGRSDNLPEAIHDVWRLGDIEGVHQRIEILTLVSGDLRRGIRRWVSVAHSIPFCSEAAGAVNELVEGVGLGATPVLDAFFSAYRITHGMSGEVMDIG